MKYDKPTSLSGAFVDKSKLTNGMRAKIVSETKPVPGQFLDSKGNPKNQDVAKVRFEGIEEPMNVNLNRATLGGLIDAFGDDSLKWQGNYLTVELEKMRVSGKAVVALYLIPEGYEKIDDESGYAVIVKKGQKATAVPDSDIPVIESDVDLKDIPF